MMTDKMELLFLFGCRIRELRQKIGMSQEDLARLCKLDRTYISGVERGLRNISLKNICILAEALEVSMSVLLEGIGFR